MKRWFSLYERHRRLTIRLSRKAGIDYSLKQGDRVELQNSRLPPLKVLNLNWHHCSMSAACKFDVENGAVVVYPISSLRKIPGLLD